MDNDTESRRLSPIAVFGDDYKYVDLINGPQGIFRKLYQCVSPKIDKFSWNTI